MPEERMATASMGPKRAAEFLSGRDCARKALSRLGAPMGPIPVGEDRAPVWPAGAVGSLSHSDGCCIAVAASSSDYRGLGVDMELEGAVGEELERLVVTPAEARALAASSVDWRTPLFSIKEAVYKAIQPLTGWHLEFTDVIVELGPDEGFVARVAAPEASEVEASDVEASDVEASEVEGRWMRVAGFVVSVVAIPTTRTDFG